MALLYRQQTRCSSHPIGPNLYNQESIKDIIVKLYVKIDNYNQVIITTEFCFNNYYNKSIGLKKLFQHLLIMTNCIEISERLYLFVDIENQPHRHYILNELGFTLIATPFNRYCSVNMQRGFWRTHLIFTCTSACTER